MRGFRRLNDDLDGAAIRLRSDAQRGSRNYGVSGFLFRFALRNFSANRSTCDLMTQTSVKARHFYGFARCAGFRSSGGNFEPTEHYRQRIRNFVKGAGEVGVALIGASRHETHWCNRTLHANTL